MKPDEYDALIADPSDFATRVFMPRVMGALGPLQHLSPSTSPLIMNTTFITPFTRPDVRQAYALAIKAGAEMERWQKYVNDCSRAALEAGIPSTRGGMALAPFDTLGDTLRGTRGIMMDMFQRPEKLQAAMDRLVPLVIEGAIGAADFSGTPMIFFPLHKGADGFMSGKQFETFYWPSLRKVLLALSNEGILPVLFAEGSYNTRLGVIQDMPKGSVAWYFDQTDIFEAKKKIGDRCCIVGNVPTSLIMTGTPQQVKDPSLYNKTYNAHDHPDDVGKEDVIALDGSEEVVVWRKFRSFTGPFVAHCHNLAHEDHAMMFGWNIV